MIKETGLGCGKRFMIIQRSIRSILKSKGEEDIINWNPREYRVCGNNLMNNKLCPNCSQILNNTTGRE